MDVNVTSIYRGAKAVWGHMRERGGGAILNTASISGLIGTPGQVAYATSKGAVVMLTKCLALDGAKDQIRVNCVCPGWVQTPMVDYHLSQLDDPEGFKERLARGCIRLAWATRRTSQAASSTSPRTRRAGSPASRSPSTAA